MTAALDIASNLNPADRAWVWLPCDVIEKGVSKSGNKGLGEIVGHGSTEHRDQDDEILRQVGMNWGPFNKGGFLTLEHPAGMHTTIGEPLEDPQIVELPDGVPATRIRGGLYMEDPVAKAIYTKALAIKKSGGRRSFGFSVEGKPDKRNPADPRDILESTIQSLAVTMGPRNQRAIWQPVMKGLVEGALGKGGWDALAESAHPAAVQALTKARDRLVNELSDDDLLAAIALRHSNHPAWAAALASVYHLTRRAA